MSDEKPLARVAVTRAMMGICHMQVCAAKDATDEEILEVCNRENPAGTTNGWSSVTRGQDEKTKPVQCQGHADRLHFIVGC